MQLHCIKLAAKLEKGIYKYSWIFLDEIEIVQLSFRECIKSPLISMLSQLNEHWIINT